MYNVWDSIKNYLACKKAWKYESEYEKIEIDGEMIQMSSSSNQIRIIMMIMNYLRFFVKNVPPLS